MISIARTFEWDMGHRVPNHESLCKNPHGHRYVMHVHASGVVNNVSGDPGEDMVIDFGKFKTLINTDIVDPLDHSFMYYDHDTVLQPFAESNKDLRFHAVPYIPTAESIVEQLARQIIEVLATAMPSLTLEKVELYETPKCKAIWTKD